LSINREEFSGKESSTGLKKRHLFHGRKHQEIRGMKMIRLGVENGKKMQSSGKEGPPNM